MASSTVIVCLLAFLTCSVNARRQRDIIVSVGTFNTMLIPGMSAFDERKKLFIETVSGSIMATLHHRPIAKIFRRGVTWMCDVYVKMLHDRRVMEF